MKINHFLRLTAFFTTMMLTADLSGQGRIFQLGAGNDYAAAVKSDQFHFYASEGRQENDMWCWAACIKMVLDYQGARRIEQCEIVKKAFGISQCVNRPGSCYNIEDGASGWVIDGKRVSASVDFSPSAFELVDQLAYKNPVIIGLNMPGQNVGHAYVLTAIFFRYTAQDKKVPYKVVLRDPWPTSPSRQEFAWDDFINRINCITYVTLN